MESKDREDLRNYLRQYSHQLDEIPYRALQRGIGTGRILYVSTLSRILNKKYNINLKDVKLETRIL